VDELNLLPASVGTVVEAADDSSSVAFACILGAAAGICWTLEMTSLVGTGTPLTRSAALALKNRSSNLESLYFLVQVEDLSGCHLDCPSLPLEDSFAKYLSDVQTCNLDLYITLP
jgi:hypothetical protein